MHSGALADTIKLLNDDDDDDGDDGDDGDGALELFQKTRPGASSFVQIQVFEKSTKARAADIIDNLRHHGQRRVQLDFISTALHGKKIGFEKVIKMIDDLVAELKQDQVNGDSKKEYCEEQFGLLMAKKVLAVGSY